MAYPKKLSVDTNRSLWLRAPHTSNLKFFPGFLHVQLPCMQQVVVMETGTYLVPTTRFYFGYPKFVENKWNKVFLHVFIFNDFQRSMNKETIQEKMKKKLRVPSTTSLVYYKVCTLENFVLTFSTILFTAQRDSMRNYLQFKDKEEFFRFFLI